MPAKWISDRGGEEKKKKREKRTNPGMLLEELDLHHLDFGGGTRGATRDGRLGYRHGRVPHQFSRSVDRGSQRVSFNN